jgi:hypothetical protein
MSTRDRAVDANLITGWLIDEISHKTVQIGTKASDLRRLNAINATLVDMLSSLTGESTSELIARARKEVL